MPKKNPSELYNEAYWQGRMLSQDGTEPFRGRDNGNFYNAAVFAQALLGRVGGSAILEVGAGIGFVIRHLRNLGLKADGIEYGKWAVDHSVCGAQWGDLTDTLPVPDGSHDLVFCVGVLSHIAEETVPHALLELYRAAKKYLWTNLLTVYHETQAHHLTFQPPEWWRERFKAAGWVEQEDLGEFVVKYGLNQSENQWSAVWGKAPTPTYTVSVVAHNNLHLTRRCIEAVQAHSADYELIVTDNASTDGTKEHLAEANGIRVIRNAENEGFILPHNRAFKVARGKFHVVLNNDVEVSPGWLEAMRVQFDLNPKLALCGVKGACCTLGPDGIGYGGDRLDYIEGSCMMARSEVIRKHGLFAEDMTFGWFEDSDLSFRLRSLGYEIAQAVFPIRHEGSATAKLVEKKIDLNAFKEHNRKVLISRWGRQIGYVPPVVPLKDAQCILLRRWGAIGDVILTTPIVAELRRRNPKARIVVETAFPAIYEGNPDSTIAGNGPYPGKVDRKIDLDLAYEKDPKKHVIQAYAEVAGVEVKDWTPKMYSTLQAREAVALELPKPDKPIAVLNTGSVAGWAGRQWAPERFDRVGARLRARGYFTVLVGNQHTPFIGVDLDYRRRPWIYMVAVMERCALFVGVDSAPFHVAQAFKRPMVVLFGSINPEYRIVPGNPRAVGLQTKNLACIGCHHQASSPIVVTGVCRARRSGAGEPCMDSLTVGDVMAAVDRATGD